MWLKGVGFKCGKQLQNGTKVEGRLNSCEMKNFNF